MPMRTLKACSLLGAVLLAVPLLLGAPAPKTRPCATVTGPITFKEKDSRRLGVRNPDGKIRTFTVDDVAMPRWFQDFEVGDRVTVTCKDAGEERRPIATNLKAETEKP